jgi:hypothetical protein
MGDRVANPNDGVLVPAATAALLSAAGPIGAMAEGILGAPGRELDQVLRANFDAFVFESFSAADEHFVDIEDEQERQRRLVAWLQDEVAALGDRLGELEASVMAKSLHASIEAVFEVWRKMSDPEMFGYLQAALRSLATRRDRFRGSVARRLLACLSAVESDHIGILRLIWQEEHEHGGVSRDTFETGFTAYRDDNLKTLVSAGLVDTRASAASFRGGRATSKWLTPLGVDFLRFVEIIKDDQSS